MKNQDKRLIINKSSEFQGRKHQILSESESICCPSLLYKEVPTEDSNAINKAFDLLFKEVFKENKLDDGCKQNNCHIR